MGKTKKNNIDAAGKPSPQPNGVAKTPIVTSPLATASPAASPAAKPKAAPAKKTAAKRSAAAGGSKSKSSISSDDIALRAYFIAEKRRKNGLHGDAAHDWIEAERQLRAESAKPARARKSA